MVNMLEFYSNLSANDWLALAPFGLLCGGVAVFSYMKFCPAAFTVNWFHRKNCKKLVDSFDIEDLANPAVFCRCWKSKKFPYCDGTHNTHNKQTRDNVGPLIVKRKEN